MRGFIVDETYRVENNKAYVYLFGRLENGESFCTIQHFKPYFSIKKDDAERAKKLPSTIPFKIEDTSWKTMQENPVVKVVMDIPKDIPSMRKLFEENGITCYEADIRFTQRYLIDNNILRTIDIEGGYEKGEYVGRIYKAPQITPTDYYPKLRVLSFDIECSMDLSDMFSISLVCRDENHQKSEVLIVHEGPLDNAKCFKTEKELLEAFRKEVVELDPDIITGWNSIDFDLKVLRDKFKEYDIPFRMARMDWDCNLRVESSFLKESSADFPGRQVLDGIHLLKLNFITLDNYKLATAARELLGEKKLIGEENKGKNIENAYKKEPQKLVDYNLKDSALVLDILEKTNAIEIMLNRTLITGMSLERVRGSIASFDSLYLRELRARNYVAPSSSFSEREERIVGGYVMEGKPGIYDYIVVCDFKSLYPSVMRTFNIDPLAFEHGKDAKDPSNKDKWITAPNGAVFSAQEGILPQMLQTLWNARDEAKKKKDAYASFAIKILMNSFFGVMAAPACRFSSNDIGNAITSFARTFIQLTMDEVQDMGYRVIYGDTDSVFVNAGAKTYEEAEKISKQITKKINKQYNEYIKKEYRRESFLELEPDKIFTRFIMPRVRGSESGAKKRYAGLVLKDGKEELSITGLETVRRDWTEVAKEFQMGILNMVFKKKDPSDYIRKFVDDIKRGKHDEKLVYVKAIRKDLDSYVKTTPPHVKAARLLIDRGVPLDSSLIEYVLTTEGPYPVQLMKKKSSPAIDYEHYIDKQVRPIADAVLGFFNTTFDDVLKGSKQMTLGGF